MSNLSAIISADTTGFKRSVEEAKRMLQQFSEKGEEAKNTMRDLGGVSDSQVAAFNRVTRTLERVSSGSMSTAQAEKALSSQVKELKIQYANLNDTVKNGDFGKSIQQSCQNAERYLGQLRQQLNAVKDKSSDTNTTLNTSSSSFDKLAGFVSKYAVQLGVASTALKVAKDAFLSTETGADNWGKAVAGAESAYKVFLTSLNNGNWSNFFNNLNDAIGGAMELYDKLDRLGSIQSNNKAAIAITERQLSELRLQKQQGENVDDKIKEKEEKLARLRKQEVRAGQEAGVAQIQQSILEQYGDADKEIVKPFIINYVINGQDAIDDVDKQIEELEKKAGTKIVPGIFSKENVVALERLSKEELEKYKTLKAIHDAEEGMAKGIEMYSNAESKANQSNQETFKYNKWGNNGGGGGTNTTNSTPLQPLDLSITPLMPLGETEKQIKDEIKALQQKIENTPDGVLRIALIAQKQDLEKELKDLGKDPIKVKIETQANNMDLSGVKNANSNTTNNPIYKKDEWDKGVDGAYEMVGALNSVYSAIHRIDKGWNEMSDWEHFFAITDLLFATVDAINSFISGIQSLMEVMHTLSAISTAASQKKIQENNQESSSNISKMATEQGLAISEATESGSKLPFPYNLAAIAAGVAAVLGAIAVIGSFAEGGIIKGSNTIGDMNLARVNSGEMILNGSQQAHLFKMLNQGGSNIETAVGGNVQFKISGKDLVGVLSNYNKKVGKVL